MIDELDCVTLSIDLPEYQLEKGERGTVVFVYQGNKGYEVEFFDATGQTKAVVTVAPQEIKPIETIKTVQSIDKVKPS